MDITPLIAGDRQVIQSYAGGQFRISGKIYETPVFVRPEETGMWEFAEDPAQIARSDVSFLFRTPGAVWDVFLPGTGKKIKQVPLSFRQALKIDHVVVDVMDTGAACRTYNVLMAEGRRVCAALLPVK